jgi:hypothetical protein
LANPHLSGTSPKIQMRLDFTVIAASLNFASSGDDRIQ